MREIRFVLLLALIIVLEGCNFTLAGDVAPPPGYQMPVNLNSNPSVTSSPSFPLLPPDPSSGEGIFIEKCAPCHGENGLGNGPQAAQLPNPVPPIGSTQLLREAVPAEWFGIITEGNLERFMPPFQSLSDRQRWDILAYLYKLGESQNEAEDGDQLYQQNCANCHGLSGKGDSPNPIEDIPDFTNQEYMAGKSNQDLFQAISDGVPPGMPAFMDKLSEKEAWAITAYLRSLTFAKGSIASTDNTTATPESLPLTEMTPQPEITGTVALSQTLDLGLITGIVLNSSGGELTDGLMVNLHGFDENNMVITGTTSLQSDGTYSFKDIEMPVGRIFLTSVEYKGVTYASEALPIVEGHNTLNLPIEVYETTKDASILSVDRLHFFFEQTDPQTLRVMELYIISNTSKQTLISSGEGQPVIGFHVPEGSTNLQIQEGSLGERFIKTEDGFADTFPIRPGSGEYQILFSYDMPFNKIIDLDWPIELPTDAIVILAPENSIAVRGDTILDGGTRDVQGVTYHLYNAGGLTPGQDFRLSVAERNSMVSSGASKNLLFGLSALGVVLVAAGIWLYRRNRTPLSVLKSVQTSATPGFTSENKETVMDAILALDDLFQEGQLPEDAYLRRRAELKTRLRELIDR